MQVGIRVIMFFFSLAASASLLASVAGHATFQELWIGDVDAGSSCVRTPASNSPVTDVTSADMACNAGAASSAGVCPVDPGATLSVEMHQQPGDRSCANEAIGGAHYGPIIVYMAAVDDATTAVGADAAWFKVSEMGLLSNNTDYWGSEVLNDNCGHYSFEIPSDIAPGNYLVRSEVIALHTASGVGGAQFYISCYQVNVGGSGTAAPDTVSIPGAYDAQDPGILINIYQQLDTYTIPGPEPYGTTSPAVAATPWPTTATWDTASQPTTVPTVVPTAAGGAATSAAAASSSPAAATSSAVAASSSAAAISSTAALAVSTSAVPSSSQVVASSSSSAVVSSSVVASSSASVVAASSSPSIASSTAAVIPSSSANLTTTSTKPLKTCYVSA